VGSICGFGGGYAGFTAGAVAGATLGSVVPVIGTVVGGVVGSILGLLLGSVICDISGRWVYRKVFPNKQSREETIEFSEERRMTPQEIAERAATTINVNIHLDTFDEAHKRFRRKLLSVHPDKAPVNATDDEKRLRTEQTRDVLACWTLVRQWYVDENRHDPHVSEAFIEMCVLKMWDAALGGFKVVRSWFGSPNMYSVVDDEIETVDVVYIPI
jgi:hypothetical protein